MTKEKGFCRALALTSQNRKYTGVLGNKRQQLNNYYKYILLKLTHTHTHKKPVYSDHFKYSAKVRDLPPKQPTNPDDFTSRFYLLVKKKIILIIHTSSYLII